MVDNNKSSPFKSAAGSQTESVEVSRVAKDPKRISTDSQTVRSGAKSSSVVNKSRPKIIPSAMRGYITNHTSKIC